MTRRLSWLTAVVPLLVLGACARGAEGAPASNSPSADAPARLPAANELVLRAETYGGFVPASRQLGQFPQLSVYGDGRVISEGPVPSIYPGPALPNLQVQQITPELVQSLVNQGVAAGVRNGADFGHPGVADAPTTRITVVSAAGKQVVTVDALAQAQPNDRRLTADQQTARTKLAAFVQKLEGLPVQKGVPAPVAYQPTGIAVFASPYTPPASGPASTPKAWPGPALPGAPIDPATKAGCVAVTGPQAASVLTAAKSANQLTPWTAGSAKWQITFRPLLPDETGCASVKAAR
jgi:hypothetical protein